MAKKFQFQLKNTPRITENIYLLYFLFIATLLHLGYFLFHRESLLIASFTLAVIGVYLVNPNMVIVLGISLVFLDVLYLLKKVPEGFGTKEGIDDDLSGNKASGDDISGNQTTAANYQDAEGNPLTFTNLLKKMQEPMSKDNKPAKPTKEPMENEQDAVNPLVGIKGVLKEKMKGNSLEEVDTESSKVKTLVNTVKEMSPEVSESLMALNSIDINELNKLINTVNTMTKGLKKDVA